MLRIPLYCKVLVWLALNLLIGALVAYAFMARDETGLNILLTHTVRERMITLSRTVAEDSARVGADGRAALLQQLSAQYGATLSVTVLPNLEPRRRPGEGFSMTRPPMFLRGIGPRVDAVTISHTLQPRGYVVTTNSRAVLGAGPPAPVRVSAWCDGLVSLVRFLGLDTAFLMLAVMLLITGLWWWPFVWNLSHVLGDLRTATQQMSRGHLQTRVTVRRRDELGELGAAVNLMAERLESYVQGQRQFIADIAHEVTSPLARMQIGLEILEERLGTSGTEAVADLREDVEQMAEMLNELLLFSRSGLEAARSMPRAVAVASTVSDIVEVDCSDVPVRIDVPPELQVVVHAPLFQRALSNLLRNARRYGAEGADVIEVTARGVQGRVKIAIQDRGPGVPEQALAHLGEPFFRPERARSRTTGGFGLGLAIVRRCAEACGGAVAFRNRAGGGFEAELDLPQVLTP